MRRLRVLGQYVVTIGVLLYVAILDIPERLRETRSALRDLQDIMREEARRARP